MIWIRSSGVLYNDQILLLKVQILYIWVKDTLSDRVFLEELKASPPPELAKRNLPFIIKKFNLNEQSLFFKLQPVWFDSLRQICLKNGQNIKQITLWIQKNSKYLYMIGSKQWIFDIFALSLLYKLTETSSSWSKHQSN